MIVMRGKTGAATIPLIDPPVGGKHLYLYRPKPDPGRNPGERRPHTLRPGVFTRRRTMGSGAWPARRRRTELDREGQRIMAGRWSGNGRTITAYPFPNCDTRPGLAAPV